MDKKVNILEELSQNFVDYSYETNSCRAFPDVRDGLKPGQRACLWEMYVKGYTSNKPHVKSAKISGGVIATWHPHGDVSIYDTFARMSQQWINNLPEVDWHGENGSQIISSQPASSRYTEARLAKSTEEGMFATIKKNTVPMIKNFSEDAEWALVLPALYPRLMVNGSQGIGTTIANVWLPHNLAEVVKVIKKYIETNEIDVNELYPDFPSGGIIINKKDIPQIYMTGKGKVILRAKTNIKNQIIEITELPYQVYVEAFIDQIKELIKKQELEGIKEIYNKSGKSGLKIEIVCDKEASLVLNELFIKTDLQKTYNANQWGLVSKTPKLLNLKEYLQIYIQHNINCIRNEYIFEVEKAKKRLEIIEGLIKALENIDNIIAIIKKSENPAAAQDALIEKYDFSLNQVKAIVDMRLSKLCHLETVELNKERKELIDNIESWQKKLNSQVELQKEFINRLTDFTNKYSKPRRTEVMDLEEEKKTNKELIKDEKVIVVVYESGFINRIYDKKEINKREKVVNIFDTFNSSHLLLFTTEGKVCRVKVKDVPNNKVKGVHLNSLYDYEKEGRVVAVYDSNILEEKNNLIFITKNGIIKKTVSEEYKTLKKSSSIAIKLKDGDKVINVEEEKGAKIILVTEKGIGLLFDGQEIRVTGRATMGVKGIELKEEDRVVLGESVREGKKEIEVLNLENTSVKYSLSKIKEQKRAGKGIKIFDFELKNKIKF